LAETIEVLIVDETYETRQSLKKMLGPTHGIEVIGEARNGKEALHRLGVISPTIIVMSVPEEVVESIKDLEQITFQYPHVSVIVLSAHRDWHYVRQYMRSGAKDYLYMPVTPDILVRTIEDVYRQDKELHRRSSEAVLTDKFSHSVRVLSFVSSKGGVGKTTLAVNTAVSLALRGKKTVLLDLDLQSGMAHLLLNLSPLRTISDLTNEMNEIDPDLLERYLSRHESGLSVLCAPKRPEEMELVKPADVRVIIQSLQRGYDYIVIDTSPTVNEILLTALELSDDVFVVSTLNLAVLKNNRALLSLLDDLSYDIGKIKHIVNRTNVKNGVTLQDVSRTFDADVFWDLNDDYQFIETSTNEGIPFVIRDKHHRLSKQLFTFTERIDTADQSTKISRRSWLRKRSSRRG